MPLNLGFSTCHFNKEFFASFHLDLGEYCCLPYSDILDLQKATILTQIYDNDTDDDDYDNDKSLYGHRIVSKMMLKETQICFHSFVLTRDQAQTQGAHVEPAHLFLQDISQSESETLNWLSTKNVQTFVW